MLCINSQLHNIINRFFSHFNIDFSYPTAEGLRCSDGREGKHCSFYILLLLLFALLVLLLLLPQARVEKQFYDSDVACVY